MKTSTKPKPLELLASSLSIQFEKPSLLKNAFIHRSYLNEHKDFKGSSNERLEFLGDSVLSLAVSRYLFELLPQSAEGQLTQLRAALVRTETLAKLARKLELGSYLYLSKGEEESGGRSNNSILANLFEALIGAIYLDQGFEFAQGFIEKIILKDWKSLAKSAVSDNKSKLQEVLQRKFHKSPQYKLVNTWGPDHNRTFEVAVFLEEKLLGRGVGRNKQTAAQEAAKNALSGLKT